MKVLKTVGVIVLILIALFFVIGLFLPSKLHMEDSIIIAKPASLVFKQVNNYRQWEGWSPWRATDPAMEIAYSGPDFGVSSSYSWKSKIHGEGNMTIRESEPYKKIVHDLSFFEGGSTSSSTFLFEEVDGGTRVTWSLAIPSLSYPVERYMGLMMPRMMKKFFRDGLQSLKKVTEAMHTPPQVTLTNVPEMKVIAVLDSCAWQDYGAKTGEMFGELMQFMQKNKNLQHAGPAMTIYYKWDEANQFTIFQAAVPVDQEVKSSGRVNFMTLAPAKAVKATHFGRYEDIATVYMALDEYVKEFSLTETCCPMEIYVTDPMMEPDTSKWQTDVYFIVQ